MSAADTLTARGALLASVGTALESLERARVAAADLADESERAIARAIVVLATSFAECDVCSEIGLVAEMEPSMRPANICAECQKSNPGVELAELTAAQCPSCGDRGVVRAHEPEPGQWYVNCEACYDAEATGDPPRFRSLSLTGYGATEAEAVAGWNERVAEHEIVIPFDPFEERPPSGQTPCTVGALQPLPEHHIGTTCDWGSCSKRATQARYSGVKHGWLPVCDACGCLPITSGETP